MNKFVVISGCSGGGKSTVLTELGKRGYSVVEEPGRRIVSAEMRINGTTLPWVDPIMFLRRVMDMALNDCDSAEKNNHSKDWVFFDRGLIDAAAGLQHLTGEPLPAALKSTHRYHHQVFLTPPWPEIYVQDTERRHSLENAKEEYLRLLRVYYSLNYDINIIPKISAADRVSFILQALK